MKKEDLKITTFEDNEKYVFVSYSSADEEEVFEKYIVPLQEKYGLRVFCDKNFKNRASQAWTQQMKSNIKAAGSCLIFISSSYVASYACLLEVFHAVYNRVPILKIQLESPSETKDHKRREVSDSTKEAFRKIGKQLGNAGFKEAENCYLDIEDHIGQGMISKYDVSTTFCGYLNQITCTKLNRNDGLEAIVRSLESIQKDMAGSMFENLPMEDENAKAIETVDKTKVKGTLVSENIPLKREIYEEMKIGRLVQTILKPLLISKATKEELQSMQEAEYSKKNFGIQYPLLLKTSEPVAERHYYKDLFQVNGENYRLCCEWYETEANNDRPFVEKWIKEHE